MRLHLLRACAAQQRAHPLGHADELRGASGVRCVAHGPLSRLQLSQRRFAAAHRFGRRRLRRAARRQPRRRRQQVARDPHQRRRRGAGVAQITGALQIMERARRGLCAEHGLGCARHLLATHHATYLSGRATGPCASTCVVVERAPRELGAYAVCALNTALQDSMEGRWITRHTVLLDAANRFLDPPPRLTPHVSSRCKQLRAFFAQSAL